MSFYHLPHPWNPGYAIPKYVMAEPMERGTFTTRWLPRRTISVLPPDYLARPVNTLTKNKHGVDGSLTKTKHGREGSLSGSSLGLSGFWGLKESGLELYPYPTQAELAEQLAAATPSVTSTKPPEPVIHTKPGPGPGPGPEPKPKPRNGMPGWILPAVGAAGLFLLLRK